MSQSRPSCPIPGAGTVPGIWLSQLRGLLVADRSGYRLGRPIDVVARQLDRQKLAVMGLVVVVGDRPVFMPIEWLAFSDDAVVTDMIPQPGNGLPLPPGDLLLVESVLGRRLVDMEAARLVKARDVRLVWRAGQWIVAGVEVDGGGNWWHQLTEWLTGRHRYHRWAAIRPLTATHDGPVLGISVQGSVRYKPCR